MNRRDILKTFGIGLAGAVISTVPSVKATEPEPFAPDVVLDYLNPLSRYVKVYLDGKDITSLCMQAAIKWDSFDRPVYGELLVEPDTSNKSDVFANSVFSREPLDDEVEHQGYWTKKKTGMVYLELEPDKKWLLAHMMR